MSIVFNLMINLYSIIILLVMFLFSFRQYDRFSPQQKLFHLMLMVTFAILCFDTLSRFDGRPGTYYMHLNFIGNLTVFLLSPVPSAVWLLYTNYEIYREEDRVKTLTKPLVVWFLLNGMLTVLSLRFHWFYFIDEDNVYHRGPLFLLPAAMTLLVIIIAFCMVWINRNKIEQKHFFSLVFFPAPPFAAIIAQILVYGTSLILNGLTISIFIVFITIQNHRMDTDFLTGVANRKKLEEYLQIRIAGSTEGRTFSAILVDLDHFKSINDCYGHEAGDHALKTTTALLKSCIGRNDFIARYGGDEFLIILDLTNEEELKKAVESISKCLELHNEASNKPYSLSFSMGYSVYDFKTHLTSEAFQKKIDLLMYDNKEVHKYSSPDGAFSGVSYRNAKRD